MGLPRAKKCRTDSQRPQQHDYNCQAYQFIYDRFFVPIIHGVSSLGGKS
jgi:hypothetical protein